MAQENFFNYGDKILSRRIGEAICTPSGIGPLCGFGSASIQNNNLLVYPYALGDSNSASQAEEDRDPLRFQLRGRINSRYIPGTNVTQPMYALVARDGTIWRSTTENNNCITVPITGTAANEVLLFAVHSPITEAVDNPVTFKAYYNNSSINFFEIYKKAGNIYWPKTDESLLGTITPTNEDDPFMTQESTFNFLEEKAKAAIPDFNSNINAWVLIGIYGSGYNDQTKKTEKFSIVPYQGQGIAELPYSYGIHNFLLKAINRVETFLFKDLPKDDGGDIYKSLDVYVSARANKSISDLEKKIQEIKEMVEQNILQPGSIILWDGDQVPDGWEDYSIAAGRVVIGYAGTSGIETRQGKALTRIKDTYNPMANEGVYETTIKGDKLPKHYHAVGFIGRELDDNSKGGDNAYLTNWGSRDSKINGTWESKHNGGTNYSNGALRTSLNLNSLSETGSCVEVSEDTLHIDKMIPAITLRYIRKSNSYKAITPT
ncbi:MAG: hypothetical protein NC131_06330 [Roseburia sp.]|nr:hypothetical protein [Roseburia sp.]